MIRTERAHLMVIAQTHEGMSGKTNEDRYAVSSYRLSETDLTPVLFAVVADGIGGHQAGEVAAELAVDHISEAIAASDAKHPKKILEEAIQIASEAIADHAASADEKQGMGATCACVWIIGDKLYTASVGDSRIYLLREGRIQQLTTDHSWVQEAIERGVLTPDMARDHPNVHVIRRYLGSPQPPEVDFRLRLFEGESDAYAEGNQGLQLRPGDTLLLCSDGLTDLVHDDEIAENVFKKDSLEVATQALINLANDRGGHDNSTVILISVPHNMKQSFPKRKNWRGWIFGGLAAILLAASLITVLTMNLFGINLFASSTATSTSTVVPTATQIQRQRQTQTLTVTSVPTTGSTQTPIRDEATYTPWPTNTLLPEDTASP